MAKIKRAGGAPKAEKVKVLDESHVLKVPMGSEAAVRASVKRQEANPYDGLSPAEINARIRADIADRRAKRLSEQRASVMERRAEHDQKAAAAAKKGAKKRDKARDDALRQQRKLIEKAMRLDTETASKRPLGAGPHPGERVIASSPALAAPYGLPTPAERRGKPVTMPFPLADEALAEFRRLYPGVPETWANVSAAECDRLRARVDELLRANEALIERERKAKRERDEAVLAMQIIGHALIKKHGPLDSAKVQGLLNTARNLVLGRE